MKKLIFIIMSIFLLSGCSFNGEKDNLTIITSNFIGYDFARAIVKDTNAEVKMLTLPGSDIHSFEPTPKDIVNIKNSDVFIYIGGESEDWVKGVINSIESDTKVIKLMDYVELKEEEIVEGMEIIEDDENDEEEIDEHIWTSPKNAIKLINVIKEKIIEADSANKDKYITNANNYIKEIDDLDSEIKEIVNNSKRKEMIFADRFPFRYLTEEYGLKYYAAFPGCSESNEASAKTIAFLINKVREDNIKVILTIELSNQNIAKTISEETGAKIMTLNSLHNISKEDFDNGLTYIDATRENIKVLKEALN